MALGEAVSDLKFPAHKCGLFLSHNEHRDYYQPLEEFIEEMDGLRDDFKEPEQLSRALATNELWVLQWYPDTPTSFYRVAAPTLEEVLAAAAEVRT